MRERATPAKRLCSMVAVPSAGYLHEVFGALASRSVPGCRRFFVTERITNRLSNCYVSRYRASSLWVQCDVVFVYGNYMPFRLAEHCLVQDGFAAVLLPEGLWGLQR
jgi:hypothetical protein